MDDLDKSVTALEIEYGALHVEKPPVCLFYFRESSDYAAMSENSRKIYQDETEGLAKLAKLKEEIRSRFRQTIKNYTPVFNENGLALSVTG